MFVMNKTVAGVQCHAALPPLRHPCTDVVSLLQMSWSMQLYLFTWRMASWSVSRLQRVPARVRKLLSCVLPTPPVQMTVAHQQCRELVGGLAEQGFAVAVSTPHNATQVEFKVSPTPVLLDAAGKAQRFELSRARKRHVTHQRL
jgi:hypothetical protein